MYFLWEIVLLKVLRTLRPSVLTFYLLLLVRKVDLSCYLSLLSEGKSDGCTKT